MIATEQTAQPHALVVLIGAPGAGKTKTGKRLARALGVEHIDTDKVIAAAHGPIADLFTAKGEPYFRELERTAVAAALGQPAVVSLGGGAVLDVDTQADLAGLPVVQLTVSREGIEERIAETVGAIEKRPLLANGGVDAWEELVARRQPLYDRLATVTIDTSHRTFDSVAEEVIAWMRSR